MGGEKSNFRVDGLRVWTVGAIEPLGVPSLPLSAAPCVDFRRSVNVGVVSMEEGVSCGVAGSSDIVVMLSFQIVPLLYSGLGQ